jgi:acetyltransferase-like isoleucine patch superfamily enzyme
MAYLTRTELESMDFCYLGNDVKISDKASIYEADKMSLGDHCRIDDFCVISGRITIGRFCHVTPMCLLAGGEPGIQIADFCTFAYGVKVFAQSDDYSGATMVNSLIPREYKQETFATVNIQRQVIVGTNAVVFPGVTLSEGCAIGAGAIVTRTTKPWGIYAGSPARRIKDREKGLLEHERRFLREYGE